MDKADKARMDKLYARLEKAGLFNEVNTLIWQRVTNAARGAYKEGKDDGFKDGYTKGKHDGYEMAIARLTRDAQEF